MPNGDDTKKTEDTAISKWGRLKSWANSKLGLLIVGAIISGILIPSFQCTQRFFEWKRQKQYETFREEYENKKLLLKKLMESSAYLANAQELLSDFINKDNKTKAVRELLYDRINEIQSKRFNINTEINYLMNIVGDKDLEKHYKNYSNESQNYFNDIKDIVGDLNATYLHRDKLDKLKGTYKKLEKSYIKARKNIRNSIEEANDENKNYHFF